MSKIDQIRDQKRKERIIAITMVAIQLASASGIVYIMFSLATARMFMLSLILAVCVLLYGWASYTIGMSKALIRWYNTLERTEKEKYLRYGDGSKER